MLTKAAMTVTMKLDKVFKQQQPRKRRQRRQLVDDTYNTNKTTRTRNTNMKLIIQYSCILACIVQCIFLFHIVQCQEHQQQLEELDEQQEEQLEEQMQQYKVEYNMYQHQQEEYNQYCYNNNNKNHSQEIQTSIKTTRNRRHGRQRRLSKIQHMSTNVEDGAVPLRSQYSEGPLSLQKHGLLKGLVSAFKKQQQQQQQQSSTTTTSTSSSNTGSTSSTEMVTTTVSTENANHQPIVSTFRTDVNEYIHNTNQIPRAIVHIGPHKTATTSIQALSALFHNYINVDGYEMPWGLIAKNISAVNRERYVNLNQFNLVSCIQTIEPLWPEAKCNNALVDAVSIIGQRQQSLIISAEELARTNLININMLYNLLIPYYTIDNIRIVVYYRRFYQWLYSYWQQFAKYQSVPDRKSFPQYVNDIETIKILHNTTYTSGCVPKYKQYFTDVSVFNLHDLYNDIDVSEHFYCTAIPNSPKTCTEVHNRNQRKSRLGLNTGKALVYEELAYYAQQYNFLSSNNDSPLYGKSIRQIGLYVHYYYEHVLNKTSYDFEQQYITCPNSNVLQWLYSTTIHDEQTLFPKFFNSINGSQIINKQFIIDSQTKLCSINAQGIIQNDIQWQEFFSNLSKPQSTIFYEYDNGIKLVDSIRKKKIMNQARQYDLQQVLKHINKKKKTTITNTTKY